MDGSIPIFKAHKTPVESCDESLEEIEKQASLLFEEFLRIPQPAGRLATQLRSKKGELQKNIFLISVFEANSLQLKSKKIR